MNALFEKYGLSLDPNGLHLYKEDLTTRDYYLECTTPVSFSYKEFMIREGSWTKLSPKIIDFLFSISLKTKEQALAFRTTWTKAPFFYKEATKTNLAPLSNGLFLNVGLTALHAVWFLQDCLDFFGVSKKECNLIIHRPCAIEPEEIRIFFKEERTKKFRVYLNKVYGYSDEKAGIVIRNIDFFSNTFLRSFSKSYDDFFLFDSTSALANYSVKLQKKVHDSGNERMAKIADACVLFLKGFYSGLV